MECAYVRAHVACVFYAVHPPPMTPLTPAHWKSATPGEHRTARFSTALQLIHCCLQRHREEVEVDEAPEESEKKKEKKHKKEKVCVQCAWVC